MTQCTHYKKWSDCDPPLATPECYWWSGEYCEHKEESMKEAVCPQPWAKENQNK